MERSIPCARSTPLSPRGGLQYERTRRTATRRLLGSKRTRNIRAYIDRSRARRLYVGPSFEPPRTISAYAMPPHAIRSVVQNLLQGCIDLHVNLRNRTRMYDYGSALSVHNRKYKTTQDVHTCCYWMYTHVATGCTKIENVQNWKCTTTCYRMYKNWKCTNLKMYKLEMYKIWKYATTCYRIYKKKVCRNLST